MRIRYSEIFFSFQGEAENAGTPAVWLRFFGCNLNCNGFGQKDPTNPETYELPYKDFDLTQIKRVEDLPVWNKGCDSSYSWSAKYKHLAHDATPAEIAQLLIEKNKSVHNPNGNFIHPVTGQPIMLVFTGGEPMMQQKAIIEIMRELANLGNMPSMVTVETNGTMKITPELEKYISEEFLGSWHWSISPKLFTVSGEQNAIKPEILTSYFVVGDSSCLKFVCNGTERNWKELEESIDSIRKASIDTIGYDIPNIWVMPVGATQEEQTPEIIGPICIEAMHRGYKIATRNQVPTFGNVIGS